MDSSDDGDGYIEVKFLLKSEKHLDASKLISLLKDENYIIGLAHPYTLVNDSIEAGMIVFVAHRSNYKPNVMDIPSLLDETADTLRQRIFRSIFNKAEKASEN